MNSTHKKKLYIIEDESLICEILKMMIEINFPDQYDISTFSSVSAALKRMAEDAIPDIIVTDNTCPNPGDGLRLVNAVKKARPETVVVIVSGDITCQREFADSPADGYIPKPFDTEKTVAMFRALFEEKALVAA